MRRQRRKRLFFRRIEEISEKDILGDHASNILGQFMFLFSVAILFSPLIGYFVLGTTGLVVFSLLVIITSPMTIMVIKEYRHLNFKSFLSSFNFLFSNRLVNSILQYTANVLTILFIGFNTILPTTIIIVIFLLLTVLPFILNKMNKSNNSKRIKPIIIPSVFSLLLVINFLFSFNETIETYYFTSNYQTVSRTNSALSDTYRQQSTLITLKNDAYKLNYGIRIFLDFEKVSRHNKIKYNFRTGLFGIKVLKDYEFF